MGIVIALGSFAAQEISSSNFFVLRSLRSLWLFLFPVGGGLPVSLCNGRIAVNRD